MTRVNKVLKQLATIPARGRTVSPVAIWVDVTDFVRYSDGSDPVSGVQRVVAEVAPLISDGKPVLWDPARAAWVLLAEPHHTALLAQGMRHGSPLSRQDISHSAGLALADRTLPIAPIGPGDVLVQLGSSWIDQGVLLATENLMASGVHLVAYVHDLTPVQQDGGHSREVATNFRRYLAFLATHGARVVTNSRATRVDLDEYCRANGWPEPPGSATGLPPGIMPIARTSATTNEKAAWPRPYVLMVGTIEARKGHLTALRAWQRLPADARPDLVCVGRWGWGSEEFRDELQQVGSANSGVHVLDNGVNDEQLADLYSECLATCYPSRWEGWGLPVSESLAFGKLPITTNVSSLPEAAAGVSVLIPPDDPQELADAITVHVLDQNARFEHEERIRQSPAFQKPLSWQQVANAIAEEIRQAQTMTSTPTDAPILTLGKEYVLGVPAPVTDANSVRIEALAGDRGTPLLGQDPGSDDILITDSVLTGSFAEPTAWGYPVAGHLQLRFTRPTSEPLVLLIATAPVVGSGTVDISVDRGAARRVPFGYGEVISVSIPDGRQGALVDIGIDVIAQDKADGLPLTLQSLLLLTHDDVQARIAVLERTARSRTVQLQEAEHQVGALREQLTGVLGSKSWRITAPLRRITGDDR